MIGARVGAPCLDWIRSAARGGACLVIASALGAVACSGSVDRDDDGFKSEGGGGSTGFASSSTSNVVSSTQSSSSSSSSGVGGAPPIPPLVEVEYGTVPVGTPVAVDVPANMLGMFAVARTDDPYSVIGFESVVAPDGASIVADYGVSGTLAGYYNYGISTVLVPQTDAKQAMPPMAGAWQLTPGNFGDSTPEADLTVWLRQTLDGSFHGGVIDVNLFVVEGVADEDYLIEMVDNAFSGYVGLWLGTVNVIPLGQEYWEIDDSNFFQALEATEGAPGKPALNVLAVGYLGGSIEGAAGVTPGAPSNPLDHGTHQSGFFWMVVNDNFFDETILRHESGHLAGLYHTSEFDPGYGDALGDTGLCADVMEQMQGCPDFDNLMFPTGGDGSNTLSPMQQQVIQASPLYRGIVEDGGGPALPLDQANRESDQRAPNVDPAARTGSVARASARVAMATARRSASWRHGLPSGLADYLSGLWCPDVRGGQRARQGARAPLAGNDFYRVLAALGGDDIATLLAIATDGAAPVHARVRALAAAGRAAPPEEARSAIVASARDAATPRQVRVAALRATQKAWPAEGRALAHELSTDGDRVVATAAMRAQR